MRSLVILVAILCSHSAFASFMIEPTISYTSGSLKATSLAGVAATPVEYTGPGGGLRLLYASGGMYMGLEGIYVAGKGKAGTTEYEMNDTNAGVLVGYAGRTFRIYAAYLPFSELRYKEKDQEDVIYTGTAAKAGVGVFLSSRMSLSAEIMSHSILKIKTGTSEVDVKDSYGSLKNDPVSLTLAYLF